MKFTIAGIILFTQNYDECVEFYGSALELKTLHSIDRPGEKLTTFLLGDTYLMVESGGVASNERKTVEQNPTKFRFNVPNVLAASAALKNRGIDVNVIEHSWGTTAEFVDPDGNRCALRSDAGFGEYVKVGPSDALKDPSFSPVSTVLAPLTSTDCPSSRAG